MYASISAIILEKPVYNKITQFGDSSHGLNFDKLRDTASLRGFSIDCSDFISRYFLPFGWSINDSSPLEPCKIKSSKKVSFVAPQNVQNNARHLYREM